MLLKSSLATVTALSIFSSASRRVSSIIGFSSCAHASVPFGPLLRLGRRDWVAAPAALITLPGTPVVPRADGHRGDRRPTATLCLFDPARLTLPALTQAW